MFALIGFEFVRGEREGGSENSRNRWPLGISGCGKKVVCLDAVGSVLLDGSQMGKF